MKGKAVLVSAVVLLCAAPIVGWTTLPRVRAITPQDPAPQDSTPPAGISEASGLDAGAIGLVNHIGGNAQAVAIQGSYAYVGIGPKLVVLDISNPADLSVVGQVFLPSGVRALSVTGDYGYAATDSDGLLVVDISDLASPVVVGACDTPEQIEDLAVAEGYVYLAAGLDGLRVVDVTSPGVPVEVGSYDNGNSYVDSVAVGRGHLYIDVSDGLRVLNVLDPTAPLEVGHYWPTGYIADTVIVGDRMYMALHGGLEIVNISNPSGPVYVGDTYELSSECADVVAGTDNTVYLACSEGDQPLSVVDVSNKRNPVELGVQEVPGPIHGLATAGSYLYVAAGESGLRAIDASNRRVPVEVGVYEQGMGLRSFGEMAVVGDILYGVDEDFQTVQISDASDLAYPTPLSFTSLITGSRHRGPAALAVADGFTYAAVSAGSCIPHFGCWSVARLRILDVSDPVTPAGVGDVVLTTVIGLIGGKTAVAVSGARVYAAHHVTLWIVDASDPYSPTVAGSWRRPSVVEDVAVRGDYVYVSGGAEGLWVVDVLNPLAPRHVAVYATTGEIKNVAVVGELVYVAAGDAGLRVLDVSDPTRPIEVGAVDTPGPAVDVAVRGDHATVALDEAGLAVVNVADPTRPFVVETYDTPGSAEAVALSGEIIYTANGEDGAFVLTFPVSGTLLLGKRATPSGDLEQGDVLTYTLTVYAGGLNVRLRDPLPASLDYVTGSLTSTLTPQAVYSPTVDAVVWEGVVPTGTFPSIRFQATPDGSAVKALAAPQVVSNTAWLTDTASGRRITATARTTLLPIPVSLAIRARPRDGVQNRDVLTYTLTMFGPGLRVRLWDPLPPMVRYVPESIEGTLMPPAVYSPIAHAVIWNGTLPTDTVKTLRFRVTPGITGTGSLDLSQSIVNTAWLTATESGRSVWVSAIVNGWHSYLPVAMRAGP